MRPIAPDSSSGALPLVIWTAREIRALAAAKQNVNWSCSAEP
jgi:hypothetical protein